ncbi:hypothetical protein CROQUDRAFT_569260 [Cronartium quercuum f. sp. fusiforme G11]|uniref:Uncharacterized protein n=1 Tax=Cronartium quercuum f. sp. fusiforme G11 TaxID=708437 RepID=A0A9P6N5N1_9BASI|nr:hypothetical protein CROQUDRAFT_569260 [Cronartium quercuum f. sp. fusiforme G11]
MGQPPNLTKILKKNYEAQKEQIENQNQLITQMQEQATAQDKAYAELISKFESLTAVPSDKSKDKGKAKAATSLNLKKPKPSQTALSSKNSSSQAAAAFSTPQKLPSSNPSFKATTTPTGSAKRSPNQVIEVEWPEGFESTKVSSFICSRF